MKHLVAVLVMIASPAAICSAAEPQATGPELLTNPGFEAPAEGADIPGWRGFCTPDWGDCAGEALLSRDTAHGGSRSLEVRDVRVRYAAIHNENMSIEPGKTYLLSGWVKTELTRGQTAYIAASWFGGAKWLSLSSTASVAGRQDWTRISFVLAPQTRPEGADRAQISLRVDGSSAAGRAWVDDLSFRECEPSPPTPLYEQEHRRMLDLARTLLLEREYWQARLATLQHRRADLEQLLSEALPFDELMKRHGEDVRAHRFLTQTCPTREEIASRIPTDDAAITRQLAAMSELPILRDKCFAELEATLALKRKLDAQPDSRRFYLVAQLAAERIGPSSASELRPLQDREQEWAATVENPTGQLLEVRVRTALDRGTGFGQLTFTTSVADARAGDTLRVGLSAPGERLVAITEKPAEAAAETTVRLQVPRPDLWFPDCPFLYTLRAALIHDGKPVDLVTQPVAFRDIRIVESDVSPTMRHAWSWPVSDHCFTINGQPYFPRGTVCGEARQDLDNAEGLFRELWLDYQRTYGNFLGRLSDSDADELARRGLTVVGSLSPDYKAVRQYASRDQGMEDFRETAHQSRWLADHPAVMAIEVGNEAELSVWGADLQSVYGEDLWQVFNEAAQIVRQELDPPVPMGYVRAKSFGSVLPAPGEDYCGVNQYTGRYWGRRCTIPSDLGALSLAASYENKPIGITEWNGPKYSWASRGVSGVDEDGAAQYIFDYFRNMTRTPQTALSTEFVLNWVVTPIEDLTTMPLDEGLKQRAAWKWSLQQGVPWYPAIWPDLLTDTPARRTMRGFQSPFFELCEAPGEMRVLAPDDLMDFAGDIAGLLNPLGKSVQTAAMPGRDEFGKLDANLFILGGIGNDQPPVVKFLERIWVIGRTTGEFPMTGDYLIQRRVNPFFPDRFLVVATAADREGQGKMLAHLQQSAEGLAEAYARQASCRRALALVDDEESIARAFARYVLELPTRSMFLGRDGLRTELTEQLVAADGGLAARWSDLGAVIVAATRELTEQELTTLRKLPAAGVNVVWSAASLQANPAACDTLGVQVGAQHSLQDSIPVADWAQQPLIVPDMGDVSLKRVEQFAGLKPDGEAFVNGTTARALSTGADWRTAAGAGDRCFVSMKQDGVAAQWVFGVDLQAAATAMVTTTSRGVIHGIYDRDTACGLERLFRVVANACAYNLPPRGADTPRLRAEITTDRESYSPGQTLRATVRVRDDSGAPCDADVQVSIVGGERFLGQRGEGQIWAAATRVGPGMYTIERAVDDSVTEEPALDTWSLADRDQKGMSVFADVTRPGWVSDWTAHVVRIADTSSEGQRLASLQEMIRSGKLSTTMSVRDRVQWVEIAGTLELPGNLQSGEPAKFTVRITQVEDDRGNDWMENTALLLTRVSDGRQVSLPLAPGKLISSCNSSVVEKRPEDCIIVDSANPATFEVTWAKSEPGLWSAALSYLYSDDYHIKDTDRLPREDPFARAVFKVSN